MNELENNIEKCLKLLSEKKIAEAKVIVESMNGNKSDKIKGHCAALEGIKTAIGPKAPQTDLVTGKHNSVNEALKKRLGTKLNDEFDQAYFTTWIRFLEVYNKQS